MKALIKWGLKQKRWTIFWWSLGVFAFIAINMAFYPTLRDQAAELNKSFADLPESAKALFSDTGGDFVSPVGFLSSQIFYLLFPMMLAILAIGQGASLLGREERDGTLELLLARPVSRGKLLFSKAVVGLITVTIVGIVGMLTTLVSARLVNLDLPYSRIVVVSLAALLVALCFGAIAYMIAAMGRLGRAASIGIASFVALAGYIIGSLVSIAEWLLWPARFLPFHYYRPAELLNGVFKWQNLGVFVGVMIVAYLIGWVSFRRRDLQ